MSSEEKEGREDVPIFLIREVCAKWGELHSFVERYHPDKTLSSRSINIFKYNAMYHARNIKPKQKQTVLVIQRPSGSEAESSGAKKQKKD